jgi:DNA-binding transcriptional LysR family regulator
MILNERILQVVLALAEELHFGRAASRLHVSQPALSGTLRGLERDLGVRLFRRTSRRVELTEAGSAFASEARRLIAEGERAMALIRNSAPEIVGPLRVGLPPSLDPRWLCPLIREVRGDSGLASGVELVSAEGVALMEGLMKGNLHAAFFAGRVCHPDLQCVTLFRQKFCVAVSARHSLAERGIVSLDELAGEDLVWLRRDVDPVLFDTFISLWAARGCCLKTAQQLSNFHDCLEFARASMGITFVPLPAELHPNDGSITYIPLAGGPLQTECSLAYARFGSRELDCFLKLAHHHACKMAPVLALPPRIHRSA